MLLEADQPFTDATVVSDAHQEDWTDDDWTEALKHASQILSARFRTAKAVRFGPVMFADEPDYVRKGEGRLIYGPPSMGEIVTPNGIFNAIHYASDPIFKNGRRKGSTRDDFIPWGEQIRPQIVPARDGSDPREHELARLKTNLHDAIHTTRQLIEDNGRLRSLLAHSATPPTPEELAAVLATEEFVDRLARACMRIERDGHESDTVSLEEDVAVG